MGTNRTDPYECDICGDEISRGESYSTIGFSTVCSDCKNLENHV